MSTVLLTVELISGVETFLGNCIGIHKKKTYFSSVFILTESFLKNRNISRKIFP